jgi:hypothetical protein
MASISFVFLLVFLYFHILHEILLHPLFGLLTDFLHHGVELMLSWNVICCFTKTARHLTCGAFPNWMFGMTMGPLISAFLGRMSYLSTSFACLWFGHKVLFKITMVLINLRQLLIDHLQQLTLVL